MSTGLIALLDDITAIAKLAAASIDDAATQAAQAGSKAVSKAAGIVIDDAAVTPRYVVGLAAKRELPIIAKIARGSLKNKLIFLLPASILLSYLAPALIIPLLMLGGAFLCYEGWHKVADIIGLHGNLSLDNNTISEAKLSAAEREEQRVSGAIRTDFILSAEIMAITLSTVSESAIWLQVCVLALTGILITLMVYGAVAIIVKADDFGADLASKSSAALRSIGRGIVFGMPVFLQVLSHIGMLAMLWVGGGIIIHGLHAMGIHTPEVWVEEIGKWAITNLGGLGSWILKAGLATIIGIVIGCIVDLLMNKLLLPAFLVFKK